MNEEMYYIVTTVCDKAFSIKTNIRVLIVLIDKMKKMHFVFLYT